MRKLIILSTLLFLTLLSVGCGSPAPTKDNTQVPTPTPITVLKLDQSNSIIVLASESTKNNIGISKWLIALYSDGVEVFGETDSGEGAIYFVFTQSASEYATYNFLLPNESKDADLVRFYFEQDICNDTKQRAAYFFQCKLIPGSPEQGSTSAVLYYSIGACAVLEGHCSGLYSVVSSSIPFDSEQSQSSWSSAYRDLESDCSLSEIMKVCDADELFKDYTLLARHLIYNKCSESPKLVACQELCSDATWKSSPWCNSPPPTEQNTTEPPASDQITPAAKKTPITVLPGRAGSSGGVCHNFGLAIVESIDTETGETTRTVEVYCKDY